MSITNSIHDTYYHNSAHSFGIFTINYGVRDAYNMPNINEMIWLWEVQSFHFHFYTWLDWHHKNMSPKQLFGVIGTTLSSTSVRWLGRIYVLVVQNFDPSTSIMINPPQCKSHYIQVRLLRSIVDHICETKNIMSCKGS
jgi:hypothetical protein